MPDEIDLLRLFRGDTPGPDEAAWEKARSAVIEIREAAVEETAIKEPVVATGRRDRWWRRPQHRLGVISGAALAAGIVAGIVSGLLQGPPTLAGPLVTVWQPARALAPDATSLQVPVGGWRLVSYLVPRGWQESTSGPEPGNLTCPTAQICYVEGDNASSPSGPANMNTLYASADGARTWSVLPVPEGVTFTSPLACATRDECAAGGLYYGNQPVYLSTTTGGHSWTVSPLPAGDGEITELACATATSCRGLTQTSSRVLYPGYPDVRPGIKLIATTDGGRHFTVTPFPASAAILSLSCPTSEHCVAYGFPIPRHPNARTGPEANKGVLLVTDDGGASWRPGIMPAHVGAGWPTRITCPDTSHCAMLGYVIGPGPQGGSMSVGADGKVTETVPDQYSVVGFSTDGGLTWTARRLPASVPGPFLEALACPTASLCYAAGEEAIPQQIGNTTNGGSSVVLVTRDAGRTWQRVTFAVPAKVPSGMQGDSFMDIGQIQCPQPDACVAIGVSDQGSTSTPIYTNHG
jgi:photosystem II stability/assembly factor-like uncharacterized protein